LYLLDHGVKATAAATVTVGGRSGDASLPVPDGNAFFELGRLLAHLDAYESPIRILPEVEPLIDALAPRDGSPESRVAAAREAHPTLDRVIGALVGTTFQPSIAEAPAPKNIVPHRAELLISCTVLPGTTAEDLERELRTALGDGDYELEISQPPTGGSTSDPDSPLRAAIEAFLAEHDPEARLVPALGYGFSDCHAMREAYDTIAYGWIPFRYAQPGVNLKVKHGADERVLIDDLVFQVRAAHSIATTIGSATPGS
jgi:acetylornithine deacetylase/succinyl-diaminopimelate desuccinylase-like protein